MKHDVFISYNHADKRFVEGLHSLVSSLELKVFRDETGLSFYDKLDAKLKAEIGFSRRLIAVISPNYLKSYWCLFEALEAIEGTDLEARFLPVILKYHPDDQVLDEDFVFEALADLDSQMRIVESKIVESRAYALSDKLDKLAFVRKNIPRIFNFMRQRIYPEFRIWDEKSVRETAVKLSTYLAPNRAVNVDVSLLKSVDVHDEPERVTPKLQSLPELVWATDVGCQAWRNSPKVVGNEIFVSSSGSEWNVDDDRDGVVCLRAETGSKKWFTATGADANSLIVSKGRVVVGCDNGLVMCIRQVDGDVIWTKSFQSSIVGGPFKMRANIGGGLKEGPKYAEKIDPFLIVTFDGAVTVFDGGTGDIVTQFIIDSSIIGKPNLVRERFDDVLYLPCADGTIRGYHFSTIYTGQSTEKFRTQLNYRDQFADGGYSVASLSSQPVVDEGIVFQGIARQTTYAEAPLVALNASDGSVIWSDTGIKDGRYGYGNLRSQPVVYGDALIFAPAYSNQIEAISKFDGGHLWSIETGQGMFEQWSSPLIHGKSLFLARHDGYVHKVDLESRSVIWSLYLGNPEGAGAVAEGSQSLPEFEDSFAWSSGKSSPILATPVIDRDRLYVGTHGGWMYCIGNIGS